MSASVVGFFISRDYDRFQKAIRQTKELRPVVRNIRTEVLTEKKGRGRLVRGASCYQFAEVDELFDVGQDLPSVFAGQAFPIEGVEDLLNHSVGDFGGEIRFREGGSGIIIGRVGHGVEQPG